MQKITKSILLNTLAYILLIAYSFSVFWQRPVVPGESLTVQAVVEPFVYITLMVIANLSLFKAVAFQEKREDPFFNENKLLPWAIAFLLMIALGMGMHATGQIVAETFVNSKETTQHYTDDFSSQVAYFIEEYPAHFFMMVPSFILLFFLAKLELNREKPELRRIENVFISFSALFSGLVIAVTNAEVNVVVVILPLAVYGLYKLYQDNKQLERSLLMMPFSRFFAIGTVVMVLFNIVFGLKNGWFTQPSHIW